MPAAIKPAEISPAELAKAEAGSAEVRDSRCDKAASIPPLSAKAGRGIFVTNPAAAMIRGYKVSRAVL